jgi:hypothetical protein
MADYDSPWKEMLDGYFPAFMAFFFPAAAVEIDWSRGYESLDTELQQIVRDAALGTRLADKLLRVWRRDGVEQFVLIHVEIQGQRDADFPKRMYVYNYRLFDRYDRPVVSLAVLTDASPTWRPMRYAYSLWGCMISADAVLTSGYPEWNQIARAKPASSPSKIPLSALNGTKGLKRIWNSAAPTISTSGRIRSRFSNIVTAPIMRMPRTFSQVRSAMNPTATSQRSPADRSGNQ